jgi:hypothetical protein
MKNLNKLAVMLVAVLGMSLTAFTAQDETPAAATDAKVITVDKPVHDFGTIKEADGKVSTTFVITNNTDAPVVLTNVRASCGCTSPEWTKSPIEPGKTGQVKATYDPKGRPGPFEKTVTVSTSGTPERLTMRIKGTVE